MGCGSSKQVKGGVLDVYCPAPSSFAVFDINSIEEPWLKKQEHHAPKLFEDPPPEKQWNTTTQPTRTTVVPSTLLEKLEAAATDDAAPKSWEEVSKALETHLKKPTTVFTADAGIKPPENITEPRATPPPNKNFSFHTLEELEAKTNEDITSKSDNQKTAAAAAVQLRKTESTRTDSGSRTESPTQSSSGFRPVKENIFVVKDRLEREKEGNKKPAVNWDPLREFPEKCPPGGADAVVVYTTSLRGVRRTYEDCTRVRGIMEQQGVVFDERDVSLDAGVLNELKELMDGEATEGPPRVFIKGRYVGGAKEVAAMDESGRLGRVLRWARVERVGEDGRHTCEGCGGVRWVPCLDCGGSCKVWPTEAAAPGDAWERCRECNENGLVRCPICVPLK